MTTDVSTLSLPPLQDERVERLREQCGIDDDDNMVASPGEEREWLIRQLAQWPTRVDERYTTNMRFLMQSAALTIAALSPAQADAAFLAAIIARSPKGEPVLVQYHPDGDWSVLNATPADELRDAAGELQGALALIAQGLWCEATQAFVPLTIVDERDDAAGPGAAIYLELPDGYALAPAEPPLFCDDYYDLVSELYGLTPAPRWPGRLASWEQSTVARRHALPAEQRAELERHVAIVKARMARNG